MFRLIYLALLMALTMRAALLVEQPNLGIKVAEGFRMEILASSNMAPNISAMTLDSKGRIVVAGAGYIKTLNEASAKTFAQPQAAISALCFDGNDLLAARDGIWKYSDTNGDGVADGTPQKFLSVNEGKGGGHAIHIGPDGWFYFIGGDALLRGSRDGKERQVMANGFCNLRDFAFNSAGDLFTYDDDVESDFFLPWYAPTRLYQIAPGQHHGWVSNGAERSWNRPEFYPDSVDILAPVGRGEPRGLIIYRHTQFPEEYRGGLFFCEAQFGKIYFCKLLKQGSTYRARMDVFLEEDRLGGSLAPPNSFSPGDLCVAPDGTLLVASAIGVMRIRYATERGTSLSQPTKLQEILRAPQPLEAWSRAKWIPDAKQLGGDAFARAINDSALSDGERVRAIEIHVELFGAIPQKILEQAAASKSPEVRARIAWALALQISDQNSVLLQRLALDVDATVRRCALEAILACEEKLNLKPYLPILRQDLGHSDKRLHEAAARICSRLPEDEWKTLWESETAHSVQTELSLLLAALWRTNVPPRDEVLSRAIEAIPLSTRSQRVEALRVTTLALGDWNLKNPSSETFAAYELAQPPSEEISTNLLPLVRKLIPAFDPVTDMEATRLLAMLSDDSPETIQKVERSLQGLNSPTTAFHYLAVLAKLHAPWPDSLVQVVADCIRNFDSQFAGAEQPEKSNWRQRLEEVLTALEAKEPKLADKLK